MIKKIRGAVLLVSGASLLTACSPEILDYRNANISNHTFYAADSNKPFVGQITNVPIDVITTPGIKNSVYSYIYTASDLIRDPFYYSKGLRPAMGYRSIDSVACDVLVKDGILNGYFECKFDKNTPFLTGYFNDGKLNKTLSLYRAYENGNPVVMTAEYNDDKLDGDMVMKSYLDEHVLYKGKFGKDGSRESRFFTLNGTLYQKTIAQQNSINNTYYDPITGEELTTMQEDNKIKTGTAILYTRKSSKPRRSPNPSSEVVIGEIVDYQHNQSQSFPINALNPFSIEKLKQGGYKAQPLPEDM